MAKGIAHWMGFDLMWNFKNPYFSASPSEFWSRWHISLSSWLRDYLYIPLGGNRGDLKKTFRNLMVTMCLGGLWHGAGWTYILWGFYHGVLLIAYHALGGDKSSKIKNNSHASKVVRTFFFFNLIAISWLFFRAESIGQIGDMMILVFTDFTVTAFTLYGAATILFFVMPLMLLEYWTERSENMLVLLEANWKLRFIVYSYFIGMLIIFPPLISQEFIYFQF
jgi:D-alanyl-lipoteichoic acid acyltransferase DltB (MBOAT superfamily)